MYRKFFISLFICLPVFLNAQSVLDNWYGNFYGGLDSFYFDQSNNSLTLFMPEVAQPDGEFKYLNLDLPSPSSTDFVTLPGNSFTIDDYEKGTAHNFNFSQRDFVSGDPHTIIFAGIELNHVEEKGTVLIIMDEDLHALIENVYDEYEQSLIGDGWSVQLLLVNVNEKDFEIKAKIKDIYTQTQDLRSLFIMGKVAIPFSGIVGAPDGHGYHTGA